jgi:hypothetical protein
MLRSRVNAVPGTDHPRKTGIGRAGRAAIDGKCGTGTPPGYLVKDPRTTVISRNENIYFYICVNCLEGFS